MAGPHRPPGLDRVAGPAESRARTRARARHGHDLWGGITIGTGCLLGYYSFVCSANHSVPEHRDQPFYGGGHDLAPVVIGDNCWIGAHACVLPGVTLGEGTVVGAGTVVSRDTGDGAVVVGGALRVVRVRPA